MMPGKKRKLFDLDEIEQEYEEAQCRTLELVNATERLVSLSSGSSFTNLSIDTVMAMAIVKFGLRFVQDVRIVLDVIPVQCGPWREEIVFRLFKLLRPSQRPLSSAEEAVLRFSLDHQTAIQHMV